ncbi:MAG: type II secretion system F family protein [Planctomycetota bacterium]|jgi:type IV pilus assembly protein PilC
MPVFAFEAMDNKGQKLRKKIEAGSRDEAIAKIKKLGLHPTAIKEEAAGGSSGRTSGRTKASKRSTAAKRPAAAPPKGKGIFGRVKMRDLTQFTNQLSTLQDAGLPIVRSLNILEGQLKPGVLKVTLGEVSEEVKSGSSLSDALAKHPKVFDRLYVNMIKAGELGGVLDTILERLATFMEKSLRLRKKVTGAMIYPIVVVVIAVGILAGIMKFVIPAFQEMFAEMKVPLPLPTKFLMGLSDFVGGYWYVMIGIPIVIYGAYYAIANTAGGRFTIDKFKLKMPLFGMIIRKSTIARFCRTIGTLIASGVPILEALAICKEATGNQVVTNAIESVHASIREGESIARPLAQSGVFDDIVVNMVDIGEETGELDKMLMKVADNYEEDVDIAVDSLTSILEPLLIVFMGGAVGFIVVALFMPLISLMEGIG